MKLRYSPDQVKNCLPTSFFHFSALDAVVGSLQYSLQLCSFKCLLTGILLQQEIDCEKLLSNFFLLQNSNISIYSKIESDHKEEL